MQIPLPSWLQTPAQRSAFAWTLLRLLLAGLLAAHGWARFISGGVVPFGEWLSTQGFAPGLLIAAAITLFEIVGTLLLAVGIWVFPLSLVYSFIYAMGIILVHAPVGWFVVGLGRNGAEYSVLLIVCLLCVGLQDVSARKSN